jgi:hypothetical protein
VCSSDLNKSGIVPLTLKLAGQNETLAVSYCTEAGLFKDGGVNLDPSPKTLTVNVTPSASPLTVTSFTPASGTSNVATNATATITFSGALNVATVNSGTIFLLDASNVVVPATLAYNSLTNTVTLTPTSPLVNSTTYTLVVKGGLGGVTDVAGNALVSDATSSFTTSAVAGTPLSLWNALRQLQSRS